MVDARSKLGPLVWISVLATALGCESPAPSGDAGAPATATAKETAGSVTVIATLPPTPSATPSTSPAPASDAGAALYRSVYFDDIDWRTGGRALFARADGSGVLRIASEMDAESKMHETRYDLPARSVDVAALEALLAKRGAATMRVDPFQAPGDDKAQLVLRPSAGGAIVLEGPPNRTPPFRDLLRELDALAKAIDVAKLTPAYQGAIQADWAPPKE